MPILLKISVVSACLLPAVAAAQGAYFAPSFFLAEVYDDNLFALPTNATTEATFIHRFGPRLEFGHRVPTLTLIGRYALDAEYVQDLPEDGTDIARQFGQVELSLRPIRRLTLGGDASYLDTRTSTELNPLTGVDQGRVRIRRISLSPSAVYEFDRVTTGNLSYIFSRDDIADDLDGVIAHTHIAEVGVAHRLTRVDTPNAAVIFRQFIFAGTAESPAAVVLLGWTRRLARRATIAARVGPRFRAGAIDGVEADASIRHGIGRAELGAAYARTATTVPGVPESVETDSATAFASVLIRPLLLSASAGIAQTRGAGFTANIPRAAFDASTPIHPWLSLAASYTFTWQRLTTDGDPSANPPVPSAESDTYRHIVLLALVMAPPRPVEL